MQQREVRFSTSQPIEHEPLHPRQTSDSCLQRILDLPLPKIHAEIEYDELDPWTSASLNGFKLDENADASKLDLDFSEASSSNEAGWTPLMYAAYLGQIETAKRLIELNVNVEQRNLLGQTALMLAATCGNEPIVRLLLKYTMNTKAVDKFGRSALHYAVLYGQNTLIESLLAQGFDPNLVDKTDNKMTPMLIACKNGKKAIVDELLKHGGNPRLRDGRGKNGEALAAAGEHTDVVTRLTWYNKLHDLFEKEDLLKYLPIFNAKNITSEPKFISLNSQQLTEMGITLLGPQKKIESLRKQLQAARDQMSRQRPVESRQIDQAQNSATSNNSSLQTNGSQSDYRRVANDQAHQLKKATDQLHHQYALNEKIIDRLKELNAAIGRQSGVDPHLRTIVQALDESNKKILAVLNNN
ncbi:Ankyrin repeat and SAM domain-containing protein 3-like isoform X2 [Aphelenchoides bicaudatus]|nr:Ankyrin repeat and SAM domain-containing protein 3-like isoform X2 [Aphelenchoides bicaudatus]